MQSTSKNLKDKIALALDFSREEEVIAFLSQLNPKPKVLKIGLELTSSVGILCALELVNQLCPESEIFLDLKLHDIPNTISKSVEALSNLKYKIKFLTLHSLGGSKMLEEALNASKNSLNIVAVTVLTSHSNESIQKDFPRITDFTLPAFSSDLVRMAYQAGVRWFVSSANEARMLKKQFSEIKLITPGIRLKKIDNDDQSRVMTPVEALKAGSDLLVIGRPIYKAENPQLEWNNLIHSLN
ncbi:MAG: orotidine-5'-phosphate decarboxylase [Candidatus Caenarcaniphilales bacterium]|nr:orotidine-5'-phosphate decarboxylase [Candidatus Caenarcaniphilales bacterium]